MDWVKKFLKEEDGVTAAEYTVLAVLVVLVIMVFFTPIRASASTIWSKVSSILTQCAS